MRYPHGTMSAYVHDKCRCTPCRVESRRHDSARQRATKRLRIIYREAYETMLQEELKK